MQVALQGNSLTWWVQRWDSHVALRFPGRIKDNVLDWVKNRGKINSRRDFCDCHVVTYWPRPSCQNRKCTGVNSRCIRSREYQDITLTVDGFEWVRFVTPTRRRWMSKYYITQCTGSSISWRSDQLERRCWNEEHVQERLGPQAPGWAAQENGKETLLWP